MKRLTSASSASSTARRENVQLRSARLIVSKDAAMWILKKLLMILLLVGLAILGTFTFQALEKPNELKVCEANEKLYRPVEDATAAKLWNIGQIYYNNMKVADRKTSLESVQGVIQQYRDDVWNFKGDGYTGQNCSLLGTSKGQEYKWSTFGSLLFAVTIFTTVGYGNIAPKTDWGRIVVFAYGMIGIPIMLWCVAVIGEVMADVFRYVYINFCCLGICARHARRKRQQREAAEAAERRQSGAGASRQDAMQSWKENYGRGNAPCAGALAGPIIVDDMSDFDDDEEGDILGIPLTVTILIVFGYVGMGAAMFGVWEKWTAMDAAYFCFVTITTIGFGDFVPGAAAKGIVSSNDAVKLIVDAIYIVIGMAIISMGFNLIQENMAAKARAITNKLEQIHDDHSSQGGDTTRPEDVNVSDEPVVPFSAPAPAEPEELPQRPPTSRPPKGSGDEGEIETSFSGKPPRSATGSSRPTTAAAKRPGSSGGPLYDASKDDEEDDDLGLDLPGSLTGSKANVEE